MKDPYIFKGKYMNILCKPLLKNEEKGFLASFFLGGALSPVVFNFRKMLILIMCGDLKEQNIFCDEFIT